MLPSFYIGIFNFTNVTSISRSPNPLRITARSLTCREFLLLQTELSQNLQQLSERARSTTEFIQRLKGMTDKVHVSIYRAFDVRFKFRVGGHVTRYGAVKLRKNMALIISVLQCRWGFISDGRGDNSDAQKTPARLILRSRNKSGQMKFRLISAFVFSPACTLLSGIINSISCFSFMIFFCANLSSRFIRDIKSARDTFI